MTGLTAVTGAAIEPALSASPWCAICTANNALTLSRVPCPQALSLPRDVDEYRRYARPFCAAIAEVWPSIEDRNIDEVYIDIRVAKRLAKEWST